MIKQLRLALAGLSLLILSACGGGGGGGGGGDNGPSQAPSAVTSPVPVSPAFNAATSEGMWAGSTSNNRDIVGLVGADGTYWVLYTKIGDASVLAGAMQGIAASNNGTFASTNGRDFSIEGRSINDVTLSARYTPRDRLDGTVTYYGTGSTLTFNSTYDVAYDKRASLQTLAGEYFGTAAVVQGNESAGLTIDATGRISGRSASGCSYTGQATPKTQGSAFTLTVTFAGGNCVNGADTVRGVGYLDPDSGVLYGAALNTTRTNGLIFSGKKSGFIPTGTTSTGTATATGTGTATANNSSSTSSGSGCGSKGGPGYRLKNGRCASWADARAGRT